MKHATFGIETVWPQGGFLISVTGNQDHPVNEPHDHAFHEIVYVRSGSALHETARGSYRLRPGDILVLKPHVWHGYREPRKFSIINGLFDGSVLREYASLFSPFKVSFEMFRRRIRNPQESAPLLLRPAPAKGKAVRQGLESIMQEFKHQSEGWQPAVTVKFLDVLVAIARLGQEALKETPALPMAAMDPAVLDTADYLEARFTEAASLDVLAGRVHLSPAYLSRRFSKQMGMGIIQYLHLMRIEEACRMLRHTRKPVTQIALQVGYDEIAYFSRCFRREMGQSPRQYRAVHSNSGEAE